MQTLIFSDILQPGYGKNAGAYRVATELRDNGFTEAEVDAMTLESYTKSIREIWSRLKIKKDIYFKALMQ